MTAIRRKTTNFNGADVEIVEADYADGHTVGVRTLDLGDQYDLCEIFGPDVGSTWVSMTLLAASVHEIDGRPVPIARTKATFRAILKQLGEAGVDAARRALDAATGTDDPEAAHRRDVGKSSYPEPSAQ